MEKSPCDGCTKAAGCGDEMCISWRLWFSHQWDNARFDLGAVPPKRRGPLSKYVFEIRRDSDGEVLFRGTTRDCAGIMGVDGSTIRAAAARGSLLMNELRVTRIESDAGEEELTDED